MGLTSQLPRGYACKSEADYAATKGDERVGTELLIAAVVGIPIIALILEWARAARTAERHHGHHDTYVVATSLSRAMVVSMVFMALMGLFIGKLTSNGVFSGAVDVRVVLGFFAAFLFVLFVIWLALRRYQVKLYDDYMEVTPFVGRSITVPYDDIDRLVWTGIRAGTGYQNLSVYVDGEHVATLLGILDIDQILMRINRFDALDHAA